MQRLIDTDGPKLRETVLDSEKGNVDEGVSIFLNDELLGFPRT